MNMPRLYPTRQRNNRSPKIFHLFLSGVPDLCSAAKPAVFPGLKQTFVQSLWGIAQLENLW
jgi:hypothetical protein